MAMPEAIWMAPRRIGIGFTLPFWFNTAKNGARRKSRHSDPADPHSAQGQLLAGGPRRRDSRNRCSAMDRYQVRSLVLTSQLPVTRWHEQIGDPTVADGILDRLVHNAHRLEMRGDSMRKNRPKSNA